MEEPFTEELLGDLLDAPNPAHFSRKHQLDECDLAGRLNALLDEKGLSRSEVVREAGLNRTFGYQIFKGQRNASRDKILQIAFAMHLNLRETNRLLRAAGASDLYCKNPRDAAVIFCLTRGYTLQEADEQLYLLGESTISRE